ncbi:MAG: LysR family transcriptional regulator [Bradymonadia bacterium]|jgi:DNA-binding transcriptional LysR family regulator
MVKPAPVTAHRPFDGTPLDWNDLRTFAEVVRQGSMAAAARSLGLHPTTVARRIDAAEAALGAPLLLRSGRRMVPAPTGSRLLGTLEPLVDALDAAARGAANPHDTAIRIATTENGARILAARVVPLLLAERPPMAVELLAGNTVVDLGRGEADLAIRTIEPTDPSLMRRRLGFTCAGLYAGEGYTPRAGVARGELSGEVVLVPSGELSRSAEARYLAVAAEGARIGLRCDSLLALASAAEAGAGLAVLPTNLAGLHPGLRLVRRISEIPARPVWLVWHADAGRNPRVRRAADIVAAAVSAHLAASAVVERDAPVD